MIEQDYIMRLISMLTAVIVKLIDQRKRREFPEAVSTIDNACKHLLGADIAVVRALSDSQLIEFFGHDPNMGPPKCYALGVLLQEKAALDRTMGKEWDASLNEQKACSLLLEALREMDKPLEPEHLSRIEESIRNLTRLELPPHVVRKVEWYHTWRGRAENVKHSS
jgi:hypothetical protein